MVHQMCDAELAAADISAIRKARGFQEKETASRDTFESYFLSSLGLEAVMTALTPEEVAAMHLLSRQKDEVGIAFFMRLYGSAKRENASYHGTVTQRFKDTLAEVKKSLVRKGLLVMRDAKQYGDPVQMERWRFCLPQEFVRFLPPLVQSPPRSATPGDLRVNVARQKLLEAVGGPAAPNASDKGRFALTLKDGTLLMGGQPFRAAALAEWQQNAWQTALSVHKPNDPIFLAPPAAVVMILGTLGAQEWAAPGQLESALKVFCFGAKLPSAAEICEEGWKWGCLVRRSENGQTFYRLPGPGEAALRAAPDSNPTGYLQPDPAGGSAIVELRAIPFEALEQLNRLACLSPAPRLQAPPHKLIASPDSVKLGRAAPDERQSPLGRWLHGNLPAFQQAFDTVSERWGKTIVHTGLLVARVRDLSLRVQLERALGHDLAVLGDEAIAFPDAWRTEVERVLKKAGFVVKEVRA